MSPTFARSEVRVDGAASESRPFNIITAEHLDRLLEGELLATRPRLDWATLLQRTRGFSPLTCPHCGDRLRPIADISERESITRVLQAVGYERRTGPAVRASRSPPVARPSSPPPT